MDIKPRAKGDALEYAVLRIEETILAHHPQFKGCDVRIEPKKIVELSGVRYEIDLLVTINPNTNYPSLHVIECKNWKDAVGAVEVGWLSQKRDALRATSASLIAPSFTKDARAMAVAKDIKLFEVEDAYVTITAPFFTHTTKGGAFRPTFRHGVGPAVLDWNATPCKFRGQMMSVGNAMDVLMRPRMVRAVENSDGPHVIQFTHAFRPKELLIEGLEVTAIQASITFVAQTVYPTLTTNLSIAKRGGFVRLEYPTGTAGHEDLVLEIVLKPRPAKNREK